MGDLNIFLSVGGVATDEQEAFVRAVEDRLRAEGLTPHTVGRNTFSVNAPLATITELMDSCSGTVVIALERSYFPTGVERRNGPKEKALSDIRLATPWNQIEAALAYSRRLPLLVIVEEGLQNEGLLEKGYDWYVQTVSPRAASLATPEFNGILASWKKKLSEPASKRKSINPAELTVGDLFYNLKPSHLRAIFLALFALIGTTFALGVKSSTMFSPSAATQKTSQSTSALPELTRTVCTGEHETGCKATHDVFITCDPPTNETIAANVCASLGRTSWRVLETDKRGGNHCGYSLLTVTCT